MLNNWFLNFEHNNYYNIQINLGDVSIPSKSLQHPKMILSEIWYYNIFRFITILSVIFDSFHLRFKSCGQKYVYLKKTKT